MHDGSKCTAAWMAGVELASSSTLSALSWIDSWMGLERAGEGMEVGTAVGDDAPDFGDFCAVVSRRMRRVKLRERVKLTTATDRSASATAATLLFRLLLVRTRLKMPNALVGFVVVSLGGGGCTACMRLRNLFWASDRLSPSSGAPGCRSTPGVAALAPATGRECGTRTRDALGLSSGPERLIQFCECVAWGRSWLPPGLPWGAGLPVGTLPGVTARTGLPAGLLPGVEGLLVGLGRAGPKRGQTERLAEDFVPVGSRRQSKTHQGRTFARWRPYMQRPKERSMRKAKLPPRMAPMETPALSDSVTADVEPTIAVSVVAGDGE